MIQELKNSHPEIPAEEMQKMASSQAKSAVSPWFRYFIKFRPEQYLSKVKIPVLGINGSLDAQVSAKENLQICRAFLSAFSKKTFRNFSAFLY